MGNPCINCGACCVGAVVPLDPKDDRRVPRWARTSGLGYEMVRTHEAGDRIMPGVRGLNWDGDAAPGELLSGRPMHRCFCLVGEVGVSARCVLHQMRRKPLACSYCPPGSDFCYIARRHSGLEPVPFTLRAVFGLARWLTWETTNTRHRNSRLPVLEVHWALHCWWADHFHRPRPTMDEFLEQRQQWRPVTRFLLKWIPPFNIPIPGSGRISRWWSNKSLKRRIMKVLRRESPERLDALDQLLVGDETCKAVGPIADLAKPVVLVR